MIDIYRLNDAWKHIFEPQPDTRLSAGELYAAFHPHDQSWQRLAAEYRQEEDERYASSLQEVSQ